LVILYPYAAHVPVPPYKKNIDRRFFGARHILEVNDVL
jgi:hypothetical protein